MCVLLKKILLIFFRLRDLEAISKSLKYYKDSYISLDEWIRDMEVWQLKAQENQGDNSKSLAELLNQQKVYIYNIGKYIFFSVLRHFLLVCVFQMMISEIESKQIKVDECQKYSEQYLAGVKVKVRICLSGF